MEDFLVLIQEHLGRTVTKEQIGYARELEAGIDKARDKLRKLSRKRIEAGKDVKTELLFIDLVRRVEKLGDYCIDIAETIARGGSPKANGGPPRVNGGPPKVDR